MVFTASILVALTWIVLRVCQVPLTRNPDNLLSFLILDAAAWIWLGACVVFLAARLLQLSLMAVRG